MSSTNDNNPKSGQSLGLNDPKTDSFQSFEKDPRKVIQMGHKESQVEIHALRQKLEAELRPSRDRQDFFNTLRIFKKDQLKKIQKLEAQPFENREEILKQNSLVAEAILQVSSEHILNELRDEIGHPQYLDAFQHPQMADLSLIGMGKLGSFEMNYASDLDLIFIYSHRGETKGLKSITNQEFYAKLAQKLVSMLATMTETGRCYEIDLDLRPSGHAGTLVCSKDHFLEHQLNKAGDWERLALLRARPVTGSPDFKSELDQHLSSLKFERPLTDEFFKTMWQVRRRVQNERTQRRADAIDLKLGAGMLMDLEFVLHGLVLANQRVYPSLRQANLFELCRVLKTLNLVSEAELQDYRRAVELYQTLLSKLHLAKDRSENLLYLDSDEAQAILSDLGLSKEALQDELQALSSRIKEGLHHLYESH